MIGKKFESYLIEKKLGQGGMGVVYKAKDTRLLRPVAIKILPPQFVADKKNRQRFMHEARAASALNHPNICTVYDIGQFDSTHYIVMEFMDGQTLKQILQQRGPMPEREVAEICLQVCSALGATHTKGIIHRDIKPDNIMLTETGQVKIMDFGLAKLTSQEAERSSSKSLMNNPSPIDSLKTSASSFEGTALYMAPEQIEKRPIDERTDIYALGVVVYELLTGAPPFYAKDSVTLMKSILADEPKAPSQVRPEISDSMEAIVLRAMAKSQKARYQKIVDMYADLNPAATSAPARSFKHRTLSWIVLSGVVLISFIFLLRVFTLKKDIAPKLPQLKVQGLSLTVDTDAWPVFSPDATQIAYLSTTSGSGALTYSLKIKELEGGQTRTIYQKSPDDSKPWLFGLDWSPEGKWIAGYKEEGGISLVDTSGNNILNDLIDFGYMPKWSPDGHKIAFVSQNPFLVWKDNEIWMYDLGDRSLEKVSPENQLSYDSPSWSPDGRWLVCLGGVGSERAIWILNLEAGEAKQVFKLDASIAYPVWSPSGKYIYFKTQLGGIPGFYRVKVDLKSAELESEAELVMPEAEAAGFNFSRDGKKIIYQTSESIEELWRMPLESNSSLQKAELITTHTVFTTNIAISPDGKTLALETQYSGARSLVLFDPERGNQKILYDDQAAFAPSWSPDGRWIAFDAGGGNNSDIWRIPVSNGKAEKIVDNPGADWMPTYSPNRDDLCLLSNRGGQFDLWIIATSSGKSSRITNTQEVESGGYWSHDGKYLAYFRQLLAENSSGVFLYDMLNQKEVEVFHFSDRKIDILTKIVWHPDDTAIYFYDEAGFAKLNLATKELSHLFANENEPAGFYRYDLHKNDLYLVKVRRGPGTIWMAEGLE